MRHVDNVRPTFLECSDLFVAAGWKPAELIWEKTTINIRPAQNTGVAYASTNAIIEITPSFQRFRLRAAIGRLAGRRMSQRENEHAHHQQQRWPEARQNQLRNGCSMTERIAEIERHHRLGGRRSTEQ